VVAQSLQFAGGRPWKIAKLFCQKEIDLELSQGTKSKVEKSTELSVATLDGALGNIGADRDGCSSDLRNHAEAFGSRP
jgi:hypothetical protein